MKAGDDAVPGLDNVLIWERQLGQENPQKRAVCAAACIMAGVIGFLLTSNVLVGGLGCVAIFASTAEMFLPARYVLNPKGASVRLGLSTTEIEWSSVKRLLPLSGGIRLSPLEKSSRLDDFRGVLLRFSGNEEAVLAKIAEFWQKNEDGLVGPHDGGGGEGIDRESGRRDSEEGS